MLRPLTLLLALALISGCQSDGSAEPSARECESVRAHAVELQLQAVDFPSIDPAMRAAELDKHRASLNQTLGDSYIAQCRQRPKDVVSCQLKATSLDLFRSCVAE